MNPIGLCTGCQKARPLGATGTVHLHLNPTAGSIGPCPGSGQHSAGMLNFRSYLEYRARHVDQPCSPDLPIWLRDQQDLPAWLAKPKPPAWLTAADNWDLPVDRFARIAPRFGAWTSPAELRAELEIRSLGALFGPSLVKAAAAWRRTYQ